MTEKRYLAVQAGFKARPAALKLLLVSNKLLSVLVYLAYIGMILYLVLTGAGTSRARHSRPSPVSTRYRIIPM